MNRRKFFKLFGLGLPTAILSGKIIEVVNPEPMQKMCDELALRAALTADAINRDMWDGIVAYRYSFVHGVQAVPARDFYRSGEVGRVAGVEWDEETNVSTHRG